MTWTSLGYRKARRALKLLIWLVIPAVVVLWLMKTAGAQAPAASDVMVVAAADTEPIFAVFGPMFEKKYGMHLNVKYGSSSELSRGIQEGSGKEGAQPDIFFSADYFYPEQLVASKLTETRQPTPYAKGLLVLYARKDSPFKPMAIELLQRKDLKSVAVANPDRAPVGRASVSVLKYMKLWDNVAPHIVQADSVEQAGEFALNGTAQLALISQTLAMTAKYKAAGSFVLFPLNQYPEIQMCAVILKAGKNLDGAHQLLKYMLSDEVQQNLTKLGMRSVN